MSVKMLTLGFEDIIMLDFVILAIVCYDFFVWKWDKYVTINRRGIIIV